MTADHDSPLQQQWREQPREQWTVSMEAIRARVDEFDRKNRFEGRATAALFVVLVLLETWQVWWGQEALERVGDLLQIAALGYVAYYFRHYYTSETKPAALGLTGTIEFYRERLARQHQLARKPWRYLLAFVPGVALSVFGGAADRPLWQNVAFGAAGVALFLVVAWINARTARKIKAEIDRLG
jgi:hypothetical protein